MCNGKCGKCKKAEFETTDVQVESLAERSGMIVDDGWISVNDRLPGNERVIAYTDNDDVVVRYRFIPAGLFRQVASEATHWRPLPPPPVK